MVALRTVKAKRLSIIVLGLVVAANAGAVDVTGVWMAEFDTQVGLRNLDTFAWVGGSSSAPNTQPAKTLIPDPSAVKEELRLLWVSCGDKDGLMSISKPFHEALTQMGIPHIWHVDSGGHTWPVWRNDLYPVAQLLFKDRKDWPATSAPDRAAPSQ